MMKTSNRRVLNRHQISLRSALKAGLLSLVFVCSSMLPTERVFAESMSMAVSEQGDQSVQKPTNGQKMENVETEFGVPIEKIDPVGEPPITKWVYQDFTVYFEHEIVLHTVMHKS